MNDPSARQHVVEEPAAIEPVYDGSDPMRLVIDYVLRAVLRRPLLPR